MRFNIHGEITIKILKDFTIDSCSDDIEYLAEKYQEEADEYLFEIFGESVECDIKIDMVR